MNAGSHRLCGRQRKCLEAAAVVQLLAEASCSCLLCSLAVSGLCTVDSSPKSCCLPPPITWHQAAPLPRARSSTRVLGPAWLTWLEQLLLGETSPARVQCHFCQVLPGLQVPVPVCLSCNWLCFGRQTPDKWPESNQCSSLVEGTCLSILALGLAVPEPVVAGAGAALAYWRAAGSVAAPELGAG